MECIIVIITLSFPWIKFEIYTYLSTSWDAHVCSKKKKRIKMAEDMNADEALVAYLLDFGARTDIKDERGYQPHQYGRNEVIRQLFCSRYNLVTSDFWVMTFWQLCINYYWSLCRNHALIKFNSYNNIYAMTHKWLTSVMIVIHSIPFVRNMVVFSPLNITHTNLFTWLLI